MGLPTTRTPNYPYSLMSNNVPKAPEMPKNVQKRPKTSENVRKCSKNVKNLENVQNAKKLEFVFKRGARGANFFARVRAAVAATAVAAPRPPPRPPRPPPRPRPWPRPKTKIDVYGWWEAPLHKRELKYQRRQSSDATHRKW